MAGSTSGSRMPHSGFFTFSFSSSSSVSDSILIVVLVSLGFVVLSVELSWRSVSAIFRFLLVLVEEKAAERN